MPKTKARSKSSTKQPAQKTPSDNPYRQGTDSKPRLYATLFEVGNRDYIKKDDLIAKVAELTGKSKQCVLYAFAVLKGPHKSNGDRSCALWEGDKVKLIAVRKRR